MGRTLKPLALLCHPTVYQWEEIQALKAQGHVVDPYEAPTRALSQYDLVLGPNGWYCDSQHRPYVGLAITAARRRRYGPTGSGGGS